MTCKQGAGVGIVGMGAYLPDEVRTNDWWPRSFHERYAVRVDTAVTTATDRAETRRSKKVDPEVARASAPYVADVFRGAKERRIIADDQESSDMEVAAARAALDDAGLTPSDVDLLLTFSQLADYPGPLNHALVAHKLDIPHSVTSMTVGADCASFVPQMTVASRLIASGDFNTALVVQGSAVSRTTDWEDPSSVNVGDAAVACVLQRIPDGYGYIGSCHRTRGDLHGGVRGVPLTDEEQRWYSGDLHKSRLVVQSMDLPATIQMGGRGATFCREVCSKLLADTGYNAEQVDWLICSQPTVWFSRACCEAMGIDPVRSLHTFEKYGHPMPASVSINLWTAYREGRLKEGNLVLLYTPGVGFIQAAALFRWMPPAAARAAARAGRA